MVQNINRYQKIAEKQSENIINTGKENIESTENEIIQETNQEIAVGKDEVVTEPKPKKNKTKNNIEENPKLTFLKKEVKVPKAYKNMFLKQTTIDIIEKYGNKKVTGYHENELVDYLIETACSVLGLNLDEEE